MLPDPLLLEPTLPTCDGQTGRPGEKGEVGPRGISSRLARRGAGRTCRHGDGRGLAAEAASSLLQSMSCTNDKG